MKFKDRVTIVTGAAQGKGTIGMPPQRIPFSELYYIAELHLKQLCDLLLFSFIIIP